MEDLNDFITGNSLLAAQFIQPMSEIQNVITQGGIALSSGDLNQLGKGIANYIRNGQSYGTTFGAVNVYGLTTIGAKQAATDLVNGFTVIFRVAIANTGACTLNVDGLGADILTANDGSALVGGELPIGAPRMAEYNGTSWRLLNIGVVSASTTDQGIIEIATNAEAITGTSNVLAMVPASTTGLINNLVPNSSSTVRGKVEQATVAEFITGTDDERYITSKVLTDNINNKLPLSTEILDGIRKTASTAQSQNGTNDVVFMTPLKTKQEIAVFAPPASTTKAGLSERATQTETNTGSDDVRFITAKTYTDSLVAKLPVSDTNTLGISQRTTPTEAIAGTNTTEYMTPENASTHYAFRIGPSVSSVVTSARTIINSFDRTLSTSYQMQKTPLIPGDGTVRVNFQFPFPNRCHNVQVVPNLNSLNFDDTPGVAGIDKNGCSVTNSRQSFAASFLLIAWGS